MRADRWVVLFTLFCAGCGGLADGSYLGEPLFALSGTVYREDGDVDLADGAELRVALFWANGGAAREERTTVVSTTFPAQYTLEVYAYPPDDVRFAPGWDPTRLYAVGFPLVYADRDADGQWDLDDAVLGGSTDQVVVWAEQPGEAIGADGAVVDLPAGFSRAAADGTELCTVPEAALTRPVSEAPTDLRIGEVWWASLVDWNCDGAFDEWDGLCPGPEDAAEWCAAGVDAADPCADICADGPDADGNGAADGNATTPPDDEGTTGDGGTTETPAR